MRHARGVDADLATNPVGDELAALDQAADRPDGHAEHGGHRCDRKEIREAGASPGPSIEAVLQQCEKEYADKFGHLWANNPVFRVEEERQRQEVEAAAWRVRNVLQKASALALDFFESRGLDPRKQDQGIYHAYMLHLLLKRHRRLLESMAVPVGKYKRPVERRIWLARHVNVGGPNAFVGLPYRRRLNNRELAIISILLSEGADIGFRRSMTVSDAIEDERRRMTVAAKRVRTGRRTWSPFAPENSEPDTAETT